MWFDAYSVYSVFSSQGGKLIGSSTKLFRDNRPVIASRDPCVIYAIGRGMSIQKDILTDTEFSHRHHTKR